MTEDRCSIETFGLSKTFDKKAAVRGLALRVPVGCFYGFLGPNGAGKSTTIKMLTGVLAPSAGSARILGQDMARRPLAVKRRIGVVPEEMCLFDNLTGIEYLTFIGRMYYLSRSVAFGRGAELLRLLGLAQAEKTLVGEYSTGMKKKLSLAAALIHDPEVLFLDEPFEGIDPVASRLIRDVLDKVVRRGGTVFLSSHILEVVERLCTHIGIIHDGSLACQGTLAEVAQGGSIEDRFIEIAGGLDADTQGLSWLGSARA